MVGKSLRFVLEALEPRRLLDATVIVDGGIDADSIGQRVIVSAPATIIRHAALSSASDDYLFRAQAGAIYDLRLSSDAPRREVGLHDPQGFQYFNRDHPEQMLIRTPVGGLWQLFVFTEKPADYTLTVSTVPSDAIDLGTAPLISAGTLTDQFTAPDQFHWYRFHASAAARYTFRTNLGTLSDSLLRIVGADGVSELAHDDISGAGDPSPFVEWVAPASGDYYFEVGSYSAGTFDLVMTEEIDDQGGQPAHIEAPTTIRGTIDHRLDEDDFLFDAKPGYLYLFFPAADSISPTLRLANADGLQSVLDTTVYWGSRHSWFADEFHSIAWTPGEAGTYQLQLSHNPWDAGDPPIGQYAIIVDAIPLTAPPASAHLINPEQFEAHNFSSPSWYQFNAIKDSLYTFATPNDNPEGDASHVFFQIVAADGTPLADNSHAVGQFLVGDSVLQWGAPSSGTFYLRVASADPIPQTLLLNEELDDQSGQPQPVSPPVTIHGSIDYGTRSGIGDVDLYQFNAIADTRYVISLLRWADVEIHILDANLSQVAAQPRYHDDFNEYNADARWTAPATGTYYLQVAGIRYPRGGVGSGPYSIYLAEAPAVEQPIHVSLSLGQAIDDEFQFPGDFRDIVFKINRRGRYRLTGSLPAGATLELGTDCQNYCVDDLFGTDSAGQVSLEKYLYNDNYWLEIYSDSAGPIHLLLEPVNSDSASPANDENTDADAQDASDDEESSDDAPSDDQVSDPYAVDQSDDANLDAPDADGEFFADPSDPLDSFADDVW